MWSLDDGLNLQITFGNTNIAKTEMFKDKKLFLAAAAWEDVNTIAFIIFGQHEEIGSFLQTQLQKSIQAKTKNKQSISLQNLITQYHFKIIPISRTKQELLDIFKNIHSAILTQIESSIIELKDFDLLKNLSSYQKFTSQDNPDLSWFSSDSHFINYNDLPYIQLDDIFSRLSKIQKDYNIKNMHTIFNWYHDGMTGKILGFEMINIGGHGADCKSLNSDLFLEVKSIHYGANSPGASFNDLSFSKSEAFSSEKMYLAISVFSDINTLQFIIFGQNKYIGKYMELILQNKKHCAIFSIPTLLRRYGFKILPISISKEVLVQMMISTNKSFTEKELNKYIVSRDDDFDITKFKYATNVSDLEAIEITQHTSVFKEFNLTQSMVKMIMQAVGPKAFGIYYYMQLFSDEETYILPVSAGELAEMTGTYRKDIQAVLDKLEEVGLIQVLNRGGRSRKAIYKVIKLEDLLEVSMENNNSAY